MRGEMFSRTKTESSVLPLKHFRIRKKNKNSIPSCLESSTLEWTLFTHEGSQAILQDRQEETYLRQGIQQITLSLTLPSNPSLCSSDTEYGQMCFQGQNCFDANTIFFIYLLLSRRLHDHSSVESISYCGWYLCVYLCSPVACWYCPAFLCSCFPVFFLHL